MGRLIDTARRGCELIGSQTHLVTLKYKLTYDLDLGKILKEMYRSQ